MYKSSKFTAIALILLYALPVCALAQASQETPWFDVEVIIFSRDAENAPSNESWPANPGVPQLDGAWRLRQADNNATQSHALLPKSDWRMKPIAYSLRQGGNRLNPLIHVAWRQPVVSRRSAQPVALRSYDSSPNNTPLIQGTLKVSVNRYLHVNLDLLLQGALKKQSENGGFIPGEFQTYRFQAHRRMRSGEIHFIDHPLMGALILINRFERPDSQPEDGTEAPRDPGQENPADEPQPVAPATAN